MTDGGKIRLEVPPLASIPDEDRICHGAPIIAVVAERDREAVLASLSAGLAAAGHRSASLRASLRSGAGFRIDGGQVSTHPSVALEAMAAALAALPPHDVLVCEGPLAVEVVRATLSIAVVANESPALLSRDVRTVRGRIDLWLFEARPALLRSLAERIAREAEPVVASGA